MPLPTKPKGALLAPTPANIALLQAQMVARNSEVKKATQLEKAARVLLEAKARENFGVSMRAKVPIDVRGQFAALFAGIQSRTATPLDLEAAIAAMPIHPLFAPIEADLSVVELHRAQLNSEEEEAKTYARRRNKQTKESE